MNEDSHLRASDQEREAVIEQLRQHTVDGRLTLDEFSSRAWSPRVPQMPGS
jgi:hypothetical protein